MRPALRIRTKLMLLVLLAALPSLGVVLHSGFTAEREAQEDARNQAQRISNSLARQQVQLTASTRQFLATLARLPVVRHMDAAACAPLFRELIEANPVYSDIVLSDASGRVLASAHEWRRSQGTGGTLHFVEAMRSGAFTMGGYRKSGSTGLDVLVSAHPVFGPGRQIVGVLSTGMRVDRFAELTQGIELPEGATVFLADGQGIRLFHRHFPDQQPEVYPIGQPVSLQIKGLLGDAPATTPFFAEGKDGIQRLFVIERVGLLPGAKPYFYAGVSIPVRTIRAAAQRSLLASLAVLVAAILAAMVAAWRMGRRVFTDRIERLAGTAKRFAAGDFTARAALPPASIGGGPDELGELGAAVDNIGQELARREEEREATLQRLALTQFTVDNAADDITWMDEDGRLLYLNDSASLGLGYSREALQGLTVFDLDPDISPQAWAELHAQLRAGGVKTFEVRVISASGAVVPRELTASLMETPAGAIIVSCGRDTTSRKRHEAVLRSLLDVTAAFTGQEFFVVLAQQLVQVLDASGVFVGEYLEDSPGMVRPLAAWPQGVPDEAEPFRLADSPGKDIPTNGYLHVPEKAWELNPTARFVGTHRMEGYLGVPLLDAAGAKIGHISVMSDKPMPADPQTVDILRLFAQRAAAELVRLRAERSILASLREKEVLLKEIHHRVKNNMQIVSSLLNLQAREVTDPAALESLAQSRGRILSMALVHEDLYQTGNLAQVDFRRYLARLAERVRSGVAGAGAVRLDLDLDELPLPVDRAIPLGLLCNELLTNAFKHAFPDGRPGVLAVGLKAMDGEALLRVADDGPGLPPGFDPRSEATLGMQLVWNLAEQLGGRIEAQSNGGAAFILRFPLPEQQPG